MKKQPFFSSGRWYQPQYPLFDSLKFIVVLSIEFGYVTSSKQSCGTLKFPNLENAMIYPAKDLNKVLLDHSVWVLSRGRSGKLADFRGCDLDGANLEMANLPFAEMQFASLKGACLQGANFRKAQLTEVQLSGARMDGADFEKANLSGADLSFSVCKGANFSYANLNGSNFAGAKLTEINFMGADLRGVNFKNARLSSADMREAKLGNVNFEGADLYEANFEGAYLKGVNLEKARFQKTDLKGAIFSDSQVNGLKFAETEFTDFDLNALIKNSVIKAKTKKEDLSVDSITIDQDMLAGAFRELIDKIRSNINDDQLKAICKAHQGVESIENIDFAKGDIVTHNDQVAIKLDFKISYIMSLLIDRRGNITAPYPDNAMNPLPSGDIFD